ncbi:MAG: hypothetical protein IMZ61_13045 [Planctomycetes bacterium]|nr:hypothetical protein [Planctomycetota bacterium]
MSNYPAVCQIVEKLRNKELHAARSGREVMQALAALVADSHATDAQALCSEVEGAIDALLVVLPPYAPPLNVIHLVMSRIEEAQANGKTVNELKAVINEDAENYRAWSENARERIASLASALIREGSTVFTFTLSETIIITLSAAVRQGKTFKVLVTESRPNYDGLMTAARLAQAGICVELSVDASIGELVPCADIMMVGAEGVMANGSAVCKVGTYPAALIAHTHRVPVYVVVDTMKFDLTSLVGFSLDKDPVQTTDVFAQRHGEGAKVAGHLFDQTPPELIDAIITERGILNPKDCYTLFGSMRFSKRVGAKLQNSTYQKVEKFILKDKNNV